MDTRPILLVEDNKSDEMLSLRALKKRNLSNPIEIVRDGAEALDYMFCRGVYANRDIKDIPAVVLLDVKLPKVDGLEVLRQIREDERTRITPVVILTSSSEQKDIMEGYNLQVNSYICKPVNFEEFSEAVSNIGLYWALINQPPI